MDTLMSLAQRGFGPRSERCLHAAAGNFSLPVQQPLPRGGCTVARRAQIRTSWRARPSPSPRPPPARSRGAAARCRRRRLLLLPPAPPPGACRGPGCLPPRTLAAPLRSLPRPRLPGGTAPASGAASARSAQPQTPGPVVKYARGLGTDARKCTQHWANKQVVATQQGAGAGAASHGSIPWRTSFHCTVPPLSPLICM